MPERNPWDDLPSLPKKMGELQRPNSQVALASRLRANILSGESGLETQKLNCKQGLLNAKVGSLFRRHSVLFPLNSNSREFITKERNRDPISFPKLSDKYSFRNPTVETKENVLVGCSTSPISHPPIGNNSEPSKLCTTDVTSSAFIPEDICPSIITKKRMIKKTGSLMSASFCDLKEVTCESAEPTNADSAPIEVPSSSTPALTMSEFPSHLSSGTAIIDNVRKSASNVRPSFSSGNYIKLDLRKKRFSRCGTRRQALSKLNIRRAKFAKRLNARGGKMGKCFRCNQEGHWANKCPKSIFQHRVRLTDKEVDEMELDYGQVEWRIADLTKLRSQFSNGPQLFELLNIDQEVSELSVPITKKGFNLNLAELRAYLNDLMHQMGISAFRPGQERAIWRTIAGKSTLLVLPTAGGKSLCYQIPAAVFQKFHPTAITLVITPLISLMQDQILSVTSPIRGAYISSSQTVEEKMEILKAIKSGQYAYVLMSPEALVESDWILRRNLLPPINFVCIDEAHCLADWSHHFRPSYLQICSLLRTRLGVNQFLGISATCAPSTIKNICQNLGMSDAVKLNTDCDTLNPLNSSDPDGGYLQPVRNPIPSNLIVTASMDCNREEALICLLQRPPFSEQLSILIYAASRDLTERLAGYIRTCLQEVKEKIGRRTVGWNTAAYHAGMTSKQRARVQTRFMAGRIRVLVATSAFGMGLNKQDLQAVIHFSLPKSFENYIQEIGRVGRNGQQSYCHTFLPSGFSSVRSKTDATATDISMTVTPEEAREANELRRHIFARHIDSVQLKRMLSLMFVSSTTNSSSGHSRVVAVDPNRIAEEVDIKPESWATLNTYMHLRSDSPPLITILPSAPSQVSISCYGGPLELARASMRSLAVSAWLGHLKALHTTTGFDITSLREVNIDLVELCNAWGWQPKAVLSELRGLEWGSGDAANSPPRRTGVSVTLSGSPRASWLWVNACDNLTERLDSELVYLRRRLKEVELAGLRSLAQLQLAIALVAVESVEKINFAQDCVRDRSDRFHARVEEHFNETLEETPCTWPPSISAEKEQSVRRTVGEFISLYGQSLGSEQVTGRVLANILHGIGSPNFPATTWSRVHRFWRGHLDVDWPTLQHIATQEIISLFA